MVLLAGEIVSTPLASPPPVASRKRFGPSPPLPLPMPSPTLPSVVDASSPGWKVEPPLAPPHAPPSAEIRRHTKSRRPRREDRMVPWVVNHGLRDGALLQPHCVLGRYCARTSLTLRGAHALERAADHELEDAVREARSMGRMGSRSEAVGPTRRAAGDRRGAGRCHRRGAPLIGLLRE